MSMVMDRASFAFSLEAPARNIDLNCEENDVL